MTRKMVSFNSILVRLKVDLDDHIEVMNQQFQFHTGSIKSNCPFKDGYECDRFNSILVRLKGCYRCTANRMWYGFNSILVRLKGLPDPPTTRPGPGFNSILVRLKVMRFIFLHRLQQSFNSILVRLKVVTSSLTRDCCLCFNSILVRLKGWTKRASRIHQKFVSIPYWFD